MEYLCFDGNKKTDTRLPFPEKRPLKLEYFGNQTKIKL